MTIKQHKSQVQDKSQNPYKINKKPPIFWAKYGIFKVKNRPVNKDQDVRDQVSITFWEDPNSGLTVGENVFL